MANYGMRDPFADINARLRKLGIKPISLGGAPTVPDYASILQQPLGMPSPMEAQQAIAEQAKASGPMYNQLTAEAEEGVMEKIGSAAMSGLEFFGNALDTVFGARAIRGGLAGKPRESLTLGPGGMFSDYTGVTRKEDYTSGRDLLEQWGILGKNQEGLDWGDVGGFLTELLLDPGTYFGAGLLKGGAKVLTAGGRALGKSFAKNVVKGAVKYDNVARRLMKTSGGVDDAGRAFISKFDEGEKAIKAAIKDGNPELIRQAQEAHELAMQGVRLTESQLAKRIYARDIVDAAAEVQAHKSAVGRVIPDKLTDDLAEVLNVPGRSAEVSAKEVLTSAIEGKYPKLSADEILKKADDVLDQPIGATFEYGVPTLFTGANTNRGIRKLLFSWLPEKAKMRSYDFGLDTKIGKGFDKYHRMLDQGGKKLRGTWLGIEGTRIFNPRMLWDARTLDVQEEILDHVRRMESSAHEGRVITEAMRARLSKTEALNPKALMKKHNISEEEALAMVERHRDAIGLRQEGYELALDEMGREYANLPAYDLGYAGALARMADVNKGILREIKEGAEGKTKGEINKLEDAYSNIVNNLNQAKEADEIGSAVDTLRQLSRGTSRELDELLTNKGIEKLELPESVVAGRVKPKLPSELGQITTRLLDKTTRTLDQELDILKEMGDKAFDYARKQGINIEKLKDAYALYDPRYITKKPRQSLTHRLKEARKNKALDRATPRTDIKPEMDTTNLNPFTGRQQQRNWYLRDIKGGTWTLNRWFKKYGKDKFSRAPKGTLEPTVTDVIDKLAKDEHWIDAAMDQEYLLRLIDDGTMEIIENPTAMGGAGDVAREADELFPGIHNGQEVTVAVRKDSKRIEELAKMIAEGDPDVAGKGMRIYSADPLEAATAYYDDVMRAGTAAKLVGDIAATHAYSRFSRSYSDLSSESGVPLENLEDLFKSLDMDTNITKRRVLQRFMTHNPEEWQFLKAKLLEEKGADRLVSWLKDPASIDVKVRDRVIVSPEELRRVLAKRGITTEEEIAQWIKDNDDIIVDRFETPGPKPRGGGTAQQIDTPDKPLAGEGVDYAEEVGELDEAYLSRMADETAAEAVEEVAEQAPAAPASQVADRPPRKSVTAEVAVTPSVARHIIENLGEHEPALREKLLEIAKAGGRKRKLELNIDELSWVGQALDKIPKGARRFVKDEIELLPKLRKSWESNDMSLFRVAGEEAPTLTGEVARVAEGSISVPSGVINKMLSLDGLPESLVAKLEKAVKNKERGLIAFDDYEIDSLINNKELFLRGGLEDDELGLVWDEFIDKLLVMRKTRKTGKIPTQGLPSSKLVTAPIIGKFNLDLPPAVLKALDFGKLKGHVEVPGAGYESFSDIAGRELAGGAKGSREIPTPGLKGAFTVDGSGANEVLAQIDNILKRTTDLNEKTLGILGDASDQLKAALKEQRGHFGRSDEGILEPMLVNRKALADRARKIDRSVPEPGEMVITVAGRDIDVLDAYVAVLGAGTKPLRYGPDQLKNLRKNFIDNEYSDSVLEIMTEKANPKNPVLAVELPGGEISIIHGQHRVERAILDNAEAAKPTQGVDVYILTKEQVENLDAPKAYDPHPRAVAWGGPAEAATPVKQAVSGGRPPAPGELPLPSDEHVRFYHYTRGDVDAIAEEGILMRMAEGEVNLEPNQIWATLIPPDEKIKNFVEFTLHKNDPRIGGTITRGSDKVQATFTDDILPADILAIHTPEDYWVRRILDDEDYINKAKSGFVIKGDSVQARGLERVKIILADETPTPVGKPIADEAAEVVGDVARAADDVIPPTAVDKILPTDGIPEETMAWLSGLNEPVPLSSLSHADVVPNSLLDEYSHKLFQDMVIDPEIGDDLKRYLSSFVKHDIKSQMKAGLIWFTDLFKQYATSFWPAFHVRNVVSGFVNSMYGGAFDPDHVGPMRWIMPYIHTARLRWGTAVKGLADTEHFKRLGLTDEAASQAMIDGIVGEQLLGIGQHMSDVGVEGAGRAGVFLNPRDSIIPSIRQAGDVVQPNSRFIRDRLTEAITISEKELGGKYLRWPARGIERVRKFGYQIGNEAEYYLRVAPVIAYLKKGMSLPDAIAKVKLTQVDYKALSKYERHYFRRIIPFYTFTRRQIPFVMEELSNPSSGMSMMTKGVTRAKHAAQDPNEPMPDWISTGVSVPLGKTEAGMNRYLTNMGGFIGGAEDVFSLLKPGRGIGETVTRSLSGIASRANPLAQAPVEGITGYSFFHQRPFSEMKSPTARLMGQMTDSEQMPRWPSPQLDALLHRLPAYGRAVSTARTLTDWPRRPIRGEDGKISVANVLARIVPAATGARITDMDLARSRNKILQERIEELLARNPNVSKFSKMYVPENRLGALTPDELEYYLLYKKLGSEASKASYARRRAAEYSN